MKWHGTVHERTITEYWVSVEAETIDEAKDKMLTAVVVNGDEERIVLSRKAYVIRMDG